MDMATAADAIKVYLEIGKARVLAGALDWPGWCRSGRDPDAALEAVASYGPRYARVLRGSRLGFRAPANVRALKVVEKLKGNATTDFGVPGLAPSADKRKAGEEDLRRFLAILRACWRTFDAAVESAEGKKLRKGPRGGGRDLEKIVEHVLGAEAGYLASLGWKVESAEGSNPASLADRTRRSIAAGLQASIRGEIAPRGPRGGVRWSARYFVRRAAWHLLDHAWEIEDRIL
ncbi:MAG TPA: hypothetical protein VFI11_14410 [Anaerolineales bacterium]|nr:hypothetical protein [Anaerolineales bacterium]